MKEVMAIVRMDKVGKTKAALTEAGVLGFTCRKVMGRGKKVVHRALYSTFVENGEMPVSPIGEYITEGVRLIPKRIFIMMVPEEMIEKIVEVMMEINCSGNPGDGKIFVLPVMETYRIRDGRQQEDSDSY